ncbi:GGDEF domain-containing protein [Patescibacteria group bacterium]|nr:GGDEF domain-containing protein [Patescibacteria group bacterium]MBU1673771.1 GGDEF domain-containing protein [Patescibacteria group bacterium]MBU1964111.1 GGDEF domain-containing protein [Patescibacteria group bacterium]
MTDDIRMIPEPDATQVAWDLGAAIMKVVNGPDRHPSELIDVLLKRIHQHLNAHRIVVVQDFAGQWKVVSHSGTRLSFSSDLDEVPVPRNGEIVPNVPAEAFDRGFVSTPEEGVGWDCWVAIRNGDGQKRLLAVDDVTAARNYETYRPSLQLMADMLGEALLLQETARQDPLTDLPNREAFRQILERQAHLVYRNTEPVCVVLAHIHQANRIRENEVVNSIMLSLARHFTAHLAEPGGLDEPCGRDEPSGLVARFGRKSLVVMLEGVDLDYAQIWANRVRGTLSGPRRFELSSSNVFELDFNLGLAVMDYIMVARFVDEGKHEPFKLAADIIVDQVRQALDLAITEDRPSTAFFTPTGIILGSNFSD